MLPQVIKACIYAKGRLFEKQGTLSKHVNKSDSATMRLTCFYGCLSVRRNVFCTLYSVQYYIFICYKLQG